jgi:putative methyltransferase
MKRVVAVYNPIRYAGECWLPVLWAQAKTYYERHGQHVDEWSWAPCIADLWSNDLDQVKQIISMTEPDVFAVSMYTWNYTIALEVAQWVKAKFPQCLVVTGGPHQYLKHDADWFRKHSYIDASLPGECFGERCIQEILDNVDVQGQINWDCVTDISYPRGRSRMIAHSRQQSKKLDRKAFDYDWSAFSAQFTELKNYISYARTQFNTTNVLSIFETTRGCPYGCTYCDWGGGINTTVIKKSIETVKQDIDAICQFDLKHLYVADANFGIFGDRDVSIMEYIVQQRRQKMQIFTMGYGGFAKTENKLDYIKQILELDIKNKLSWHGEIKMSMQSIDPEILDNIDRKNISFEKQLNLVKNSRLMKKMPLYVELIYGLPGMTLDKFYHELDVFGQHQLSIQWYPWILLPEAPAYSRDYRDRHKIQTSKRLSGWESPDDSAEKEIVISSYSYTTDDYFEMVMASGVYKLLIQAGLYKKTTTWIMKHQGVGIGQICQEIWAWMGTDPTMLIYKKYAVAEWNGPILHDPTRMCVLTTPEGNEHVLAQLWLVALAFEKYQEFAFPLGKWLAQKYQCPDRIISQDQDRIIHQGNLGRNNFQNIFYMDRKKVMFGMPDTTSKVIQQLMAYKNSGHILQAKKKLFGLIEV